MNAERGPIIVVLDDDPTGVQTVHDINVYTVWDADTVREAFETEDRMFFLLTIQPRRHRQGRRQDLHPDPRPGHR